MGRIKNIKITGIKSSTVNIFTLALTAIMCVLVLFINIRLEDMYNSLTKAMEGLESSQTAADEIESEAYDLTSSLQHFVVLGETAYLDSYIKKLNSDKTYEAIEVLKLKHVDSEIIQLAIDASADMTALEQRIMLLACRAYGVEEIPAQIEEAVLEDYEEQLTDSAKILDYVLKLTFSDEYSRLNDKLEVCMKAYLEEALNKDKAIVNNCEKNVDTYLVMQRYVDICIAVIMVAMAYIIHTQITHVLREYVGNITRKEMLRIHGLYELRYLAAAYNKRYEIDMQQREKLKERADIDALTEVRNRGAFDRAATEIIENENTKAGALMLVDVDKFKEINDSYGHDRGDEVLKKVAQLLSESFRSNDLVGRYGGDEFSVWLVNLGRDRGEYVINRINDINKVLQNPENGGARASVSVGVGFYGEGEDLAMMYKKADEALYIVKENGRCGISVNPR